MWMCVFGMWVNEFVCGQHTNDVVIYNDNGGQNSQINVSQISQLSIQ